jgi:hypothetical protein
MDKDRTQARAGTGGGTRTGTLNGWTGTRIGKHLLSIRLAWSIWQRMDYSPYDILQCKIQSRQTRIESPS